MSSQLWVATRKGLFRLSRRVHGWEIDRSTLLGDPTTMVLVDRDGAVHAAQNLGHFGVKIKRSTDDGQSWEERAAPAYPLKPDDEDDIDPTRRTPVPWDLKTIWSLELGAATRPAELWCGTIPGGLFRSSDGGDSWSLVESLWHHPERRNWFGGGADFPGIHSVLVDPRNPDVIRIGVSCAGLWVSTDGGQSWECRGRGMRAEYMPPEQAYEPGVQDPHRVVQCTHSPDRLWIQHHNGIFRSDDAGDSFTEIGQVSPSAFGFAVAVHPEDPDTAWFVPGVKDEARYPVDAALCVTRTRDGGERFEALRNGLPQRHAYDIVYRHGLDIDSTGNVLAFGSTTGNLWLSEDQGDSWTRLTDSLPPIYGVRFAE